MSQDKQIKFISDPRLSSTAPLFSPFYLILGRNWFEHSKIKSALFLKSKILGCEKEGHFRGNNQGFTRNVWYFSEGMHCLEFFLTFLPPFQLPTRIPISSLSLVVDILLWVNCDQWVHTWGILFWFSQHENTCGTSSTDSERGNFIFC